MAQCEFCGEEVTLPYKCGYCGSLFCSRHRLPENHSCPGLDKILKESREQGRIYRDVSADLRRKKSKRRETEKDVGPKIRRPEFGYLRQNYRSESPGLLSTIFSFFKSLLFKKATLMLMVIMVVFYIGQLMAMAILGGNYYRPGNFNTFLYFLAPAQVTVVNRPWTLITSIFTHGGFFHLFVNGFVLLFIGSSLERRIGKKRFLSLFIGAGVIAALAQIAVSTSVIVVLGASGAILGILGALTAIAPRMPILLFFIIPMPLWLLTLGYGSISAILAFTGTGGSIGHMAHFVGLVVGLLYGYKLRRDRPKYRHPMQQIFGSL